MLKDKEDWELLQETLKKEDFFHFDIREKVLMLEAKNDEVVYVKELFLGHSMDLSGIFYELKCIAMRINEDSKKIIRMKELHELTTREARTHLTQKELDDLLIEESDLHVYINYYILDVKSIYIWMMIFIDKLAKYLGVFIKRERNVKTSSFRRFLNSIKTKKGKEIEQLTSILTSYRPWFKTIKDTRNNYTTHHPSITLPGIVMTKNGFSTDLQTSRGDKPSMRASNDRIDHDIAQLKKLLKELNDFLCKNIQTIPF